MDMGTGADYACAFNRLFDPKKEYKGKTGAAFGGYALSGRYFKKTE